METDVTALPPEVAENVYAPGELEARVTVSAVVEGLPNGSCSATVIGPRVAVGDAAPDTGLDVTANWEGGAAVTAKLLLVAGDNDPSVALRV
jgi:hypothetical protein